MTVTAARTDEGMVHSTKPTVLLDLPAHMTSAQLLPLVIDLDREALSPRWIPELFISSVRCGLGGTWSFMQTCASGRNSLDAIVQSLPGLAISDGVLDPKIVALVMEIHEEGGKVILLTRAFPALARRLCDTKIWADEMIVADEDGDVGELERLAAVMARCPSGFTVLPSDDLSLWRRSGNSLPSASLYSQAEDRASPEGTFAIWSRAMRLHQWCKNLLIFVPLILAGHALDVKAWLMAVTGFICFGLVASATYLINDLHDLEHDRAHRSKRYRPLASGLMTIPSAVLAIAAGLCLGIILAASAGPAAVLVIGVYIFLTLVYTLILKRIAMIDTVALAALFTLRLLAGSVFCGIAGSPWLFVLSMFIFTSLALAKRFSEIRIHAARSDAAIPGRGYLIEDGPVVLTFGAATATAAVLIVSLYIFEAPARQAFYIRPEFLWAAPVAVFLWLARVWTLCGRGSLNDDPVEFALKDRASLALGLIVAASFGIACVPA